MQGPAQPGARIGVALSLGLAALWGAFIAAAAFDPALFAKPAFQGGVVTLWFVFAIGLIWTTVSVVGLYVLRVNALEDRR